MLGAAYHQWNAWPPLGIAGATTEMFWGPVSAMRAALLSFPRQPCEEWVWNEQWLGILADEHLDT